MSDLRQAITTQSDRRLASACARIVPHKLYGMQAQQPSAPSFNPG